MTNVDRGQLCTECRDVIMYCKCWMGKEREVSHSESFEIWLGNETALWNSLRRRLEGSFDIVDSIRQHLTGEEQFICDVGKVWMDEREPIAVAMIAEQLGFQLGEDAPNYGLSTMED